jgi:hypothetical protein
MRHYPIGETQAKTVTGRIQGRICNSDDEDGRTQRSQFHIHTKTQVPVAVKLRRTPFALRTEVDKQIKDMENLTRHY